MEILNDFLNYIARTNLFNFAIFFAVIVFLCIKMNVKEKLETAKSSVDETIEQSKATKEESEVKLNKIEESISHISEEIDEILKTSKVNAEAVGEKIIQDANHAVAVINDNTQKAIDNKTDNMRNDILAKASCAAVKIAKDRIINELNNNKELHERLIDESVERINGVEL